MALTNKLTAIADAIRTKTGETKLYTLDEMASAISAISEIGGGGSEGENYKYHIVKIQQKYTGFSPAPTACVYVRSDSDEPISDFTSLKNAIIAMQGWGEGNSPNGMDSDMRTSPKMSGLLYLNGSSSKYSYKNMLCAFVIYKNLKYIHADGIDNSKVFIGSFDYTMSIIEDNIVTLPVEL